MLRQLGGPIGLVGAVIGYFFIRYTFKPTVMVGLGVAISWFVLSRLPRLRAHPMLPALSLHGGLILTGVLPIVLVSGSVWYVAPHMLVLLVGGVWLGLRPSIWSVACLSIYHGVTVILNLVEFFQVPPGDAVAPAHLSSVVFRTAAIAAVVSGLLIMRQDASQKTGDEPQSFAG